MIVPLEEINYIFDERKLLPGDILLMNIYDEVLRSRMKCRFEHVAIYLGDALMMEANGAYVTFAHLYSYAFKHKEDACVLRMKTYSPIHLAGIARSARTQLGREYINTMQFRNVRSNKNTNVKDTTNRSFCSRLVAQCYLSEGIHIVPNADFCEPDDFLQSELLEEVQDGVMPFTKEFADVVMYQQKAREDQETINPNAEWYRSLGELCEKDIQDLNQVILAVLSQPSKEQQAIQITKDSGMFQERKRWEKNSPFLFDDDAFLANFPSTEKALHFLYSAMIHYDQSILRNYQELHVQMIVIASYHQQSKFVVFLRDLIGKMVEEAIDCRKRMTELYYLLCRERTKETEAFIEKYGTYSPIEYVEKPVDVSFILHDIMKSSYHAKENGSSDCHTN